MTELERAVQWLEELKDLSEQIIEESKKLPYAVNNIRHYKRIDNCRVLLDALRWRNVDKEPPKQHQRCLVVKGNDFDKHPFIATYADDRWYGWEGRIPDITHWRPLPEPPKEG